MTRHVAVAWYCETDLSAWKQLDPQFMTDYGAWLTKMQSAIAALERGGVTAVRVDIDPEQFKAWADSRGYDYSTASRGSYAAFRAMQDQIVIPTVPPTRMYG